jgi:transposase
MAVKAMMGPIFDMRKKMPLTGIRHFFDAAPLDLLFGDGVEIESLNDHALARNLDDLFDSGLEDIFWECSSLIKRRFGFDSKIRHMDATNYSVWAVPPAYWEDGALPAYGGNAKNGRKDLLQYSAATVTDGDRILEYCKAYSGNTSDVVMNRDTLDFLRKCVDPAENTVIADCKLVTGDLITALIEMNMGFISKLPEKFSGNIRDRMIEEALASKMASSSIEGYSLYETEKDTVCGKLRLIAFRSPKGYGRTMDYLEGQGKKDAEKRFKQFGKKEFDCGKDAEKAFAEALKGHAGSAYIVSGRVERIEKTVPREKRGRPPKDSEGPEKKISWKIETSMEFDRKEAERLADARGISVIVTNIPKADEDSPNVRHGAKADTILRLYLDQYKAEHTYRLMKSGMGVDSVYVRTPSRANALLFVVAVAALVSSVIDALLRRSGKGRKKTVKQISTEIQNAILEYRRGEDSMGVLGPPGSQDKVLAYLAAIGMDPSVVLDMFGG